MNEKQRQKELKQKYKKERQRYLDADEEDKWDILLHSDRSKAFLEKLHDEIMEEYHKRNIKNEENSQK